MQIIDSKGTELHLGDEIVWVTSSRGWQELHRGKLLEVTQCKAFNSRRRRAPSWKAIAETTVDGIVRKKLIRAVYIRDNKAQLYRAIKV